MNSNPEHTDGNRWKRLGDLLLDAGLITAGQLAEALAEKERLKCFLGQALVKLGYVSQDELISFLVKQCKIPHINLNDYKLDPRVIQALPEDLCLRRQILAIDRIGSILTVCMVNPLDIDALEQARDACPDLRIKPILCTPEHFEAAARQYLAGARDGLSEAAPEPDLTLSSFGLSKTITPPGKAPAPKKSIPEPAPKPGGAPALSAETFSLLVREILGELLNTFQGPLQGHPESTEGLWSSADGRSSQFAFTLNLAGRLCYVSPAVTEVTGYAPEEFRTKFLDLLTNDPGNSMLTQAIALGLAGHHRAPVKAEFLAKNGTRRMLVVFLNPVFDEEGQLIAVQGVARDVTCRAATQRSLYQAATNDPLTGLLNRSSFLTRLAEALSLSKRHGTPVSIGVVDVDGFTRLNDFYGHDEGDAIIQQVGHILRQTLRGEDIVARSGGDEFCILMPYVNPDEGKHAISRYRDALAKARFVTLSGNTVPLTITAGFTTITDKVQSPDTLLEAARLLVRRGKASGGNRVVMES